MTLFPSFPAQCVATRDERDRKHRAPASGPRRGRGGYAVRYMAAAHYQPIKGVTKSCHTIVGCTLACASIAPACCTPSW